MKLPAKRLVIVSNRLPVVVEKQGDSWDIHEGTGGLVTALAPVLKNRGGLWIGWTGSTEHADLQHTLNEAALDSGYSLKQVSLTKREVEQYYNGFANEIIWPLFHDLQSRCNFDPEYWQAYQDVNKKFAQVIVQHIKQDDYIWVHDYHLMNVAREIRCLNNDIKIGFFLHIPFPPIDIFLKLPWRYELLQALLQYDLIGFQTLRDRRNFITCVKTLIKDIHIQGKSRVITVKSMQRVIKVGNFPISIDYKHFSNQSATREVADCAWYIHENIGEKQIILGIDRLDYTKGILERLKAFEKALTKHPDIYEKVTFIQVVIPSRVDIPEYQLLRTEIEQLVSNINGRFTRYGWVPIQYIFRSLTRYELLAHYRTAEIAMVTPLKDGMNLVAKEYCACSLDRGVVILSEFAGASAQLHTGAIIVNPYDVEIVADAIYEAFKMPREERLARMNRLRRSIMKNDIFSWVDSFLEAAFTENLYNFPVLDDFDYIAQVNIPGRTDNG